MLSPGRCQQINGDFAAAAKIGEVKLHSNSSARLAGDSAPQASSCPLLRSLSWPTACHPFPPPQVALFDLLYKVLCLAIGLLLCVTPVPPSPANSSPMPSFGLLAPALASFASQPQCKALPITPPPPPPRGPIQELSCPVQKSAPSKDSEFLQAAEPSSCCDAPCTCAQCTLNCPR